MGELINYLVGGVAILYMTFRLKDKSKKDPSFNIAGMGIKTLLNLAYLGIACYAILLLIALSNA